MMPTAAPDDFVDLLERRNEVRAEGRVFVWYGETETVDLTHAELSRRARATAVRIRALAEPGDRALLLCPPGIEYVIGFFGCLYAGVIAVPAHPIRGQRGRERVTRIAARSRPRLALVAGPRAGDGQASLELGAGVLPTLSVAAPDDRAGDRWQRPTLGRDALALLQYTSGSTADPKGVMISHGNLLANCRVIHERFEHSVGTRGVIWLPPHHDMGLVGGLLQPVFSDIEVVLMSPLAVVQRPRRWLEAISRFGAEVSGAPNFAYELCVRRIPPPERADLDLGSWKVAFTGAEPVRADTLARFAEAFAPSGFDPRSFYPCYGLAESTLFVTGGARARAPRVLEVATEALERGEATEPADGAATRSVVACGAPGLGHELQIVDPEQGILREDGRVGEIWLAGPSVSRGYWDEPELTRARFQAHLADGRGPYLRTGDLGFVRDGELHVVGRIDDVIILRGRNHYPHDIEATVQSAHPAVRLVGAAAFTAEVDGEDGLVVLAEVLLRGHSVADILSSIRGAVTEAHDVQPRAVVLVRRGGIPRTSSGKVQRFACRRGYLEGSMRVIASSVSSDVQPVEVATPPGPIPSVLVGEVLEWVAKRTGTSPDALDPDRSLLALGLDSLGLVALGHECHRRWGAAPALGELVDARLTPRSLATWIADSMATPVDPPDEPPPAPGPTDGQRALWLLERVRGGRAGLELARAFAISEGLDAVVLRRAIERVLARHDALRLCLPQRDGILYAEDRGGLADAILELDARDWDERTMRERLVERALEPFDLARGPLVRVTLFSRGDDRGVLLLQAHHSVVDLGSLGILGAELGVACRARANDSSPLPLPPAGSFASFARAEREQTRAQPQARQRALEHWATQLGPPLPPALDIPGPPPPCPRTDAHGGRVSFAVPPAVLERLRARARAEPTTPYVLLVSAWALLLHRLWGGDEILLGCPVSRRGSARFARTVGYCVDLLPLRFAFDDDPSFGALVTRTHRAWVAGLEHVGVSFPDMVEALRVERRPGLGPLFHSVVSMGELEDNGAAAWVLGTGGIRCMLGDLSLESIELPLRDAQVDLALSLVTSPGEMAGALEYDARRLSPETAQDIEARYLHVLDHVLRDPSSRSSRVPLVAHEVRRQLLARSQGEARTPPHASILAWWEHCVRAHGDRPALEHPRGSLTFGELDGASGAVAETLRQRGLRLGEPVAIHADRTPETVIAMLGVLRAGGAYLALDPAHPRARRTSMSEHAGVRWLLARGDDPQALPSGAELVTVDPSARPSASLSPAAVSGHSAAYLSFTSGSTGTPKGVVVEHRGLCNLVAAQGEAFGLVAGDRVLQCASFGFDASVSEVFVTLLAGATLRLAARDELLIGHDLARALARDVTLVTLTPSVLSTLEPGELAAPMTLVCAGETCPDVLVERWAPGRRFIAAYGPTEATVCATTTPCSPGTPGAVIGRPLANVHTYVLDADLEPTPLEVIGEVYIGGLGVARGYQGRPGATAERFVPDPHAEAPGARLYRTGDRAFWRRDGRLQFAGRQDRQVKIRGFRVELGEVEHLLAAHPAVRECVVVARRESGEARLAAYFVPAASGASFSTESLRDHLRARLPAAMVPTTLVEIDALPLTASGKLDRRALPVPGISGEHRPAPTSDLEQLVMEIWREVIPTAELGIHDNFFDAGGTSLSAARAHARLQQALGRELALVDLFTYPTVSALARRLEHGHDAPPAMDRFRDAAGKARALARRRRPKQRTR